MQKFLRETVSAKYGRAQLLEREAFRIRESTPEDRKGRAKLANDIEPVPRKGDRPDVKFPAVSSRQATPAP